jgi:hypothetical protein
VHARHQADELALRYQQARALVVRRGVAVAPGAAAARDFAALAELGHQLDARRAQARRERGAREAVHDRRAAHAWTSSKM